jgi:hypothetical protein
MPASIGDNPSDACSACVNLAFDEDLQLIFQRTKDESLHLTQINNTLLTNHQLGLWIAGLRQQINTAHRQELSKSRNLTTAMSRLDEYKMLALLHISNKNRIARV